jgi:amine acid ABC transporter, permease protein, 3-TM region, His/Glu/Gln/Arg/opine family
MSEAADTSILCETLANDSGLGDYAKLTVVSSRHPGRIVGSIVVVLLLALIAQSLATNPRWEWNVVAEYFTAESVFRGLGVTLWLTAVSATLGFVLGGLVALARLSKSPILSGSAWFYTWFFRSVPILVLLVVLYNWGYLYEFIGLGIPFTDISFFKVKTVTLLGPLTTAIIGLSLNEAAYSAEIIRAGILSVDQGQLEAAASLGISRGRRFTRIVLPQAMRAIVPNAFNSLTGLVKGTSIVYVLAVYDLFHTIQVIYNRTQRVLPMLLVAVLWYVILTTILSVIQYYVERAFAKGSSRGLPKTPPQRVAAFIVSAFELLRSRLAAFGKKDGDAEKGERDACDA